jgi:hypothetical protein
MGKTLVARLAAAAAGGVLALAAAAPALAQDTTTVEIKADQVPTTAADFGEQECDGPFQGLADDQDGWHFILTQYSGDLADLTMSIDFEDAAGAAVHVDAGPGDFVETGGAVHLFLTIDAGLTLVSAEATGPAEDFGGNAQLNLSHTCPGTPGNGETPPPEESGETPPPGENGEGGEPGENGENGGLPVTGMQLGGLLVLGSGLLAAGVAMVAVRRRKGLGELTES